MYPNEEIAMKRALLFATLMLIAVAAAGQTCSFFPAPGAANFGNYSVFAGGGPLTTTPTFNVRCTANNMTVYVLMSRGTNSASFNPRTMLHAASGNRLNYNIYLDAANTQIWGDNSGGTSYKTINLPTANTALATPVPIYASAPRGADVVAGTYNDSITVTMWWNNGSWQNTTATLNVSTTVLSECTVSAFAINFGAYEPVVVNAAAPLDSTATINVFCTKNTSGSATLDNGSNFSAPNRRMKTGGGAFMTYNVYKDAARATVWDAVNINSATSTSKLTALGGGFVAYGRIAAGQDIGAGAYTDTLQSVVNY